LSRNRGGRDPETGGMADLNQKKPFLPKGAIVKLKRSSGREEKGLPSLLSES